jgi:nucleoside-diphosphate-sugar epimerase
VKRIGRAAGWHGRVVAVPRGQLPVPFPATQDLVMNTERIRRELGYQELVGEEEALKRTIAWERANPSEKVIDYAAEDAILADGDRDR